MSGTREQIYSALFALASGAFPWASAPSRRLKLWSDVALAARPALFQDEAVPEVYDWKVAAIPRRTIGARLWIYTDAKDPTVIGATQINDILDGLDAALKPPPGQLKQTLGGLCDACHISRIPLKVSGVLDGDGIMIVDVEIIVP